MMLGENDLPCFIPEVRDEVSRLLQLPSEDWMQDWPIEVADSERIQEFLDGYSLERREEHRSAIATLIIASLDERFAVSEAIPDDLLNEIAAILRLHPDLLGYWASLDSESSDEDFWVTPWIRSLRHRA